MLFDQITIVGVGLIGGSVGLAAKARGVARRVVGHGRDPAKLREAVRLGAIDRGTTDLAEAVGSAGLVVIGTPVDLIADTILAAAPHCPAGAVFTDGGSTKGNLVAAVEGKLPPGIEYVPAHPLAGSEKTGVVHARADLFVDRVTVLTPTVYTDSAAVEKVSAFWQALGCRLVTMTPAEHDAALAVTSHLPHAVAAGVAGVTDPDLLALTAGGFRDLTRIAAGDPRMWEAIFRANRPHVLDALSRFTARLDEFRRLLVADDATGLTRWLTDAKRVRDALGS